MVKLNPRFLLLHEQQFAEHIGLELDESGYSLVKKRGTHLCVERQGAVVTITYNKTCELFRGIALLKEDIEDGEVKDQPAKWESMGVFCDCSRNAVLNVDTIKTLILDIAALGFDQLQLYTEDTFEVKEYPYFGHLRGRYTQEEIQGVDEFAKQFGVELVPAVQTLAHLNAIFQWKAFEEIHDVADILLCDEEKTYTFLERLVASLRSMYTTDKINIGMDEAHMLGLGQYLNKNGYHSKMDIFLKHINRVMTILRKYGFKPMMWSDMFFKIACGRCTYEALEAIHFEKEQLELIPEDMTLTYWNYSSVDKPYMDRMFQAHQSMGRDVVFAGGFRKWAGFCPTLQASFNASRVALESAYENGIRKVLVTGWGDDGAEGAMYLLLPGLALYAEDCYRNDSSDQAVDHRLQTLFGYGLEEFRLLEKPNWLPGNEEDSEFAATNLNKIVLWNDPLLGKYDRHLVAGCNRYYEQLAEELTIPAHKDNRLNYLFETVQALCDLLAVKTELGNLLREAYCNRDKVALKELCGTVTTAIERLDRFHNTFRRNWLRENKIFGFDVQDIRFGALRARLVYTRQVVEQYVNGEIVSVAELEQPSLYMDCRGEDSRKALHFGGQLWAQMATPSVL